MNTNPELRTTANMLNALVKGSRGGTAIFPGLNFAARILTTSASCAEPAAASVPSKGSLVKEFQVYR